MAQKNRKKVLKMSEDEKKARKSVARAFRFMVAPMLAAFVFACVRASANGGWMYYIVFFLCGMIFPLATVLIRNPYSSEPHYTATEFSWKEDFRFYFTTAAVYFVIELVILFALVGNKVIPGADDMVDRIGIWDTFLFLLLIVLVQNGIIVFSSALNHLVPILRLHRSVYNRENWIRHAGTRIFTDATASTYCMPRGGKYQEVGIVLVEMRRKEQYANEEGYLSGRSRVLFAPLFLVRSTTPVPPPEILYKPEHRGMVGLRFLGDGLALVEQSYANESFNRDTYTIRLRKFLQLPSGCRKSLLPRLVFPGRCCPVLVPKKNHSPRLFLLVSLAVLCAVWTTGCYGINGVVVDENGAPMKDIRLRVEYKYPPSLLFDKNWEGLSEDKRLTIDGEFSVRKIRWHGLRKGAAARLYFSKEGYYTEIYDSYKDFETDEDRQKTPGWRDMRVVMRKRSDNEQ